MKTMIARGLNDFLDENDLSDDQAAEVSEGEGIFIGQMQYDGMLL
jgi:hypothetical protein